MTDIKEIAKLLCDRGDYLKARESLRRSCALSRDEKKWPEYLEVLMQLLRVSAELEDGECIKGLKQELNLLVAQGAIELTPKVFYVQAIYASNHLENEQALKLLEQGLIIGLKLGNKREIAYIVYGYALIYFKLDRLEETKAELKKLKVFLQVLDVPDLSISASIIEAHLLRKERKFDESLEVCWRVYELLRHSKQLTLYITTLYAMGQTYLESGDAESAKIYLSLAIKAVDSENMPYSSRVLRAAMDGVEKQGKTPFDLVFNRKEGALYEKSRGAIQFNNQFVLLDMLNLFIRRPGEVYSKENLVSEVWKQQYDPMVHDNKIYVTIKRLRKLIEPDYDKPRYIFRAKNGYYLNRNARILIEP